MTRFNTDPAPTRDTSFVGKMYHWTYGHSRKRKFPLILHKGPAEDCKRVHRFKNGDKA